MGKRNRRNRAKKRKPKPAARAGKRVSLAYGGNKYKTEELVQTLFHAEVGIYESFVMTDRKLTDHTVESALERLILRMRKGPLPSFAETPMVEHVESKEEDLVIWNVRRNWEELSQKEPRPSRDNRIGVLRTILGSVEVWKSVSPASRGYLSYLEGFLKEMGVSVERCSPDSEPMPGPDDDELLLIGRAWCRNADPEAAAEFRERAKYMIRSGQAERVVEVCQQLMGETGESEAMPELSMFSILAQHSLRTAMG